MVQICRIRGGAALGFEATCLFVILACSSTTALRDHLAELRILFTPRGVRGIAHLGQVKCCSGVQATCLHLPCARFVLARYMPVLASSSYVLVALPAPASLVVQAMCLFLLPSARSCVT